MPMRNTQGLTMYCAGAGNGAWLEHSDQYRGLRYCYTHRPEGAGVDFPSSPVRRYEALKAMAYI